MNRERIMRKIETYLGRDVDIGELNDLKEIAKRNKDFELLELIILYENL